MPRGTKRKRTVVTQREQKRPIDKQINTITVEAATPNRQIELYLANFPGTVVGLRWDLAINNKNTSNTGSQNDVIWAIVIVPDGLNPSTIAFAADNMKGNLYQPEQNVMACGVISTTFEGGVDKDEGMTKTMRKLKVGDKLWFVAQSRVSTDNFFLTGHIQYFYKT